ncbi:MAG: glycosyltransferase family 4 protein [Enhydrobacter sp.]|nr:MAG: glycosyltransferase family 4 protein [Enhydrobacter sp.]
MSLRIGFLISHPIQYYAPIFRELARRCDLDVFFAHKQTASQQASAGFGVDFEWDVDLLSGYSSRFLANVAPTPSTDRFGGCNTPEIADAISRGGYDAFVVPGWSLRSYWQAVLACRRARVPVLVRGDSQLAGQRGGPMRLAKAALFPTLLRMFDGYLHVGKRNREYLQHYGAPSDRLFFSPACVDNAAFAAASRAVPASRGDGGRILFVGKLVGRKHPLDLVHAAARLASKGRRVQLVFAGSGELAATLEAAARSKGVPAQFLGFVNQSRLPAVYAAADVIVLPSDGLETWGLAVNEAMACGVPAVVSDMVGCGPDLVEPGRTGEVFPLGDVPALAEAISRVLAFDRAACRDRLAERMEIYSPKRAAEGIIEAANRLRLSGNR